MLDPVTSFYDNPFDIPVEQAVEVLRQVPAGLSDKAAARFEEMFEFFARHGFEAGALEYSTFLTPGTRDVKSANNILGRIAHAVASHLGFQKLRASDQWQAVLMTNTKDPDRGTVWSLRPCYRDAWLRLHPSFRPPVAHAMEAADERAFLYTWKRSGKGHGEDGISGLGDGATCDWPIRAHRQARTGDAFVLLKQGIHDNPGIIGYGRIIDDRKQDEEERQRPRPYRMDIRFTRFQHPDRGLLLDADELIALGFTDADFLKQGSGHPLPVELAGAIIGAIEAKQASHDHAPGTDRAPQAGAPRTAVQEGEVAPDDDAIERIVRDCGLPPERREMLREELVRNRAHILELKALAGGRCQLTGKLVADGLGGDLTHGHHIHHLSLGGPDSKENIVVLSPDMHALVHRRGTRFDWSDLSFIVNGQRLPLRRPLHLRRVPGKVTDNLPN